MSTVIAQEAGMYVSTLATAITLKQTAAAAEESQIRRKV